MIFISGIDVGDCRTRCIKIARVRLIIKFYDQFMIKIILWSKHWSLYRISLNCFQM